MGVVKASLIGRKTSRQRRSSLRVSG